MFFSFPKQVIWQAMKQIDDDGSGDDNDYNGTGRDWNDVFVLWNQNIISLYRYIYSSTEYAPFFSLSICFCAALPFD